MSNTKGLKLDYKTLKPCSCTIDGQSYFCMFRTPKSPCMRERKKEFSRLTDAMEERFNTIKDNMIDKMRKHAKRTMG